MKAPASQPLPELIASRSALANTLIANLKDRCNVPTGARTLVAVSGGPDSVAMAVLAAAVSRRRSPSTIEPIIGHVDHGLRPESAEEADLVRDLAKTLDVPSVERRVRVESTGDGIAAAAREARYAALLEMAREQEATAVLTAHHADDQAETVVLALARGSGIAGLAGMPFERPLGDGVSLVRPLLSVSHAELVNLCQECGLPSCEDPGNTDLRSPRAHIRHQILPSLEGIHPGATKRIAAVAEEAAALATPDLGSNSLRRWRKATLAALSPSQCASTIRRSVIAIDPAAGGCPRSHWNTIAAMVRNETCEPRAIVATPRVRCVLGADEVYLEEVCDD